MAELVDVLTQHPQACIMPDDPRRASGVWQIDYASRAGFERYVARRQALPQQRPGDAAPAWMALVNRQALLTLLSGSPGMHWQAITQQMPGGCWLAQRAFVHSYADYQKSERHEALHLVPTGVRKLVDVGGGEGGFLRAFQKQRAGQVLLVEPNIQSSAVARQHGIAVLNERFEAVDAKLLGPVDCISFLDVLEHFDNPLAALQHAHRLLCAGGFVILSVPNVGHWSVVQDLLQGRFDYLPIGILCCTHLRFFTGHSLRQLLADANFEIDIWHNQASPMPEQFARALDASGTGLSGWNQASLSTDSFHVLASKRP
jgi:SAM-dependent methyltransferase